MWISLKLARVTFSRARIYKRQEKNSVETSLKWIGKIFTKNVLLCNY